MKRRKNRSRRMQITQLWTRSDAVKAIPYLRSIIASLRESYLEVLNAERQLARASQKKVAPETAAYPRSRKDAGGRVQRARTGSEATRSKN